MVRLHLTVCCFRYPNRACPRATFAEECGPSLPRFARRTTDATALLLHLTRVAGGEVGAHLAQRIGLPTSPDTLLRLQRQLPEPDRPTTTVLGVDDLSLRRGRSYATLLIDLVTHQRVDLLEGREAAVLAEWLKRYPGVTTIVRDRSEAYAEGATTGAPPARQVVDRFHLVKNASAALDELLKQRRRVIAIPSSVDSAAAKPLSPSRQRQADRRAARLARWERVRALRAAGMSLRGIATEVGLYRKSVRSLLATPEPSRSRQRYPSPADVYSPTLRPQDRWQQGRHTISQLYREIVVHGYSDSRSLLAQSLAPWRPPRAPRDLAALGPWLADARSRTLPSFAALADGLIADLSAVEAALTTPWSNGQTEGQVQRLKLIKRQMYGRAKFDLHQRRVLAA